MSIYSVSNGNARLGIAMHNTPGVSRTFSFNCRRLTSQIDQRIQSIYKNAIMGKAHKDMKSSMCPRTADYGECGDRRGELTECRCPTLSRMKHPELRQVFEDKVIQRAVAILKSQSEGKRSINLAFFASGKLFGEATLLFRLFDQLKKENIACEVNIKLIDKCYETALNHNTAEDALRSDRSLDQFVNEMCQTLPKNVTLSGQVYSSDNAYIEAAKVQPEIKHDLIVGADIENLKGIVAKIHNAAGRRPNEKPLVLIKGPNRFGAEIPAICGVKSDGNLTDCIDPSKVTQPIQLTTQNSTKSAQVRPMAQSISDVELEGEQTSSINSSKATKPTQLRTKQHTMSGSQKAALAIGGLALAALGGYGIYRFVTSSRRGAQRAIGHSTRAG